MPMMAAAPAAAAAAAAPAKKKNLSIKLLCKKVVADKVKLLKHYVRLFHTLNLTDAKKAVEGAPTVIAEAAPKEEAEKMKKALGRSWSKSRACIRHFCHD